MRMKPANTPIRSMLGLCLFAVSAIVSADDLFDRGVSAFKKKDFSTAVSLFEKSRSQGNSSAILSYNLGAGYYKLGDYAGAQRHFSDASRDISHDTSRKEVYVTK